VRQVLRFLDVDDTLAIPAVELESLRTPRYVLLDQLMRGLFMARRSRVGKPVSRALDALTPGPLQRSSRLGSVWRRIRYVETPPSDEELMLELRRRFKSEVEALSDYLGRDLVSLWGYDSID